MPIVNIQLQSKSDTTYVFEVSKDTYSYRVTVPRAYYKQLTGGKISLEQLVEKSFAFLLEREGPQSILQTFDLPLIQHYFPDYEQVMRKLS